MRLKIVLLVLVSLVLPMPAGAGMVAKPDPVEKGLLDLPQMQKTEGQKMTDDFLKSMKNEQPGAPQTGEKKSGSTWWKWALGVLIVGGIAAAASGGGGGGGGGTSSGGTTVTGSW